MRWLVLCAALAVFLFGPSASMPAKAFANQTQVLPALDAEGRTLPLTVSELDPQEQVRFAELTPGSDDARRFLYTRGYLRYCRLVVEHQLSPLDLPRLPSRENWNRQFLTEHEATEILDLALGLKLEARRFGG